jgi:hypothetical protein
MDGMGAGQRGLPRDRRLVQASVLAVLVVVGLLVAAPAGARSSVDSLQDRVVAQEVCENMVRDAAVAAARQQLVGEQTGRWRGTRYTCRYDFGTGGVLLARVRVYQDDAGSEDAFAARQDAAKHSKKLYGLGSGAFRLEQTLLVARKDNFVLTVDGRRLAEAVSPDSVVFSATRAVFDCW